jgi:pimeloyl-ACP methyl ester carboxylesterase
MGAAAALCLAACSSGGTVTQTSASSSSVATARDITFTSGGDTIYGTFQPAKGNQYPGVAVLIIAGSGATDRDGNDAKVIQGNTYQRFAQLLADDGVSSLRYDKLGTGKTGLATHADGQGITFGLYGTEALDAYRTLAAQPGVDPKKLIILGHSEGGLYALLLANKLAGTATSPHALILASTVGVRYIDLLDEQYTASYQALAATGKITPAAADLLTQQLNTAFAGIRAGQGVTTQLDDKSVAALLSPTNVPILEQEDQQDPAALAKSLGPSMPVLVLRGTKDSQVSEADTAPLLTALQGDSAVVHDEVPDADHLYQQITGTPNPAADYANPSLPLAPQVGPDFTSFLQHAF